MERDSQLPADLQEFILTRIDSVPHLEALLIIWTSPLDPWTEAALANALYIAPSSARAILRDLLRRGWIRALGGEPAAFTYEAAWDPDGEFMRRLERLYRGQLIRVTTLIHSNVSAAVRNFADAFDFKKD